MKQPTGDRTSGIIGKCGIENQFGSARGQARNLVIDASQVVGMTDTEAHKIAEDYVIQKTLEALLHREEAPHFDQTMVVFGGARVRRITKPK